MRWFVRQFRTSFEYPPEAGFRRVYGARLAVLGGIGLVYLVLILLLVVVLTLA